MATRLPNSLPVQDTMVSLLLSLRLLRAGAVLIRLATRPRRVAHPFDAKMR